MFRLTKLLTSVVLSSVCVGAVFAAPPKVMITHNTTDVESNAYIAGTIPSKHPTAAHSDNRVAWAEVRLACFGHVNAGKCDALVKVATGPSDGGAIDIGVVSVDLNTGMITPGVLSANGYSLIVNGPGEVTLVKD